MALLRWIYVSYNYVSYRTIKTIKVAEGESMKHTIRVAFVMCFALVVSMVCTAVLEASCEWCQYLPNDSRWVCTDVDENHPYGYTKCKVRVPWSCDAQTEIGSEFCAHPCAIDKSCTPTQNGMVSLEDLSPDSLDKVEEIQVSVQE